MQLFGPSEQVGMNRLGPPLHASVRKISAPGCPTIRSLWLVDWRGLRPPRRPEDCEAQHQKNHEDYNEDVEQDSRNIGARCG